MKKYLLAFLLCMFGCRGFSEIDSLYNSKWKAGVKISLLEMHLPNETEFIGHLLFGIPITRNIHHSLFNFESGIYAGGYYPFDCPSENYYKTKRGYNLALPLKIKYDRDGMFLASGLSNRYCHTKYDGFNYWHEPVSFSIDSYFLLFNFTIGFEKYISHDCEVFVDVFYERTLSVYSDARQLINYSYLPDNIGFSLGFFIRSN